MSDGNVSYDLDFDDDMNMLYTVIEFKEGNAEFCFI